MKNCYAHFSDGHTETVQLSEKKFSDALIKIKIADELDYEKIVYIDIDTERSKANSGENGFYLLVQDMGASGDSICYFKKRENAVMYQRLSMPIIGVKTEKTCYIGIMTGMPFNVGQVIELEDGVYKTFFRINIECEKIFEPIELTIYPLHLDCDYSDMARKYREHQMKNNGFVAIKDRLTPELDYASKALCVRIRQAWKPVPSPVPEQTVQNEPPVHAACTFKQCKEIVRYYKEKGVKYAEFCLVGWNIKGHDGRWPQILPPEESLGDEQDLIDLINYTKSNGYLISCHTNCTDHYPIAENYDWNNIAVKNDYSYEFNTASWSGGRSYKSCPKQALEIVKKTFPDVAKLGFRGLHYVDVITITLPRRCYSKNHPVNFREGARYLSNVLDYSRQLFGGSGSEGGFDYSLQGCDFTLYVSFKKMQKTFTDKFIPFWQLVYHGIVLSNPFSTTANAILNDDNEDMLKLIEYGGRPLIYYYAHFVSNGKNWIGKNDFTCDNIEYGAEKAKEFYDFYEKYSYLQTEFMEKHEEISPNVFEVTYSDGSIVTVDYNNKTYKIDKA